MSTDLDTAKRNWLEGHLEWAAGQLGVDLVGEAVHGPRVRSVGSRGRDGAADVWLRVVFEDPEWGEGDYLGHNLAANAIPDVPKPQVLRWLEWHDRDRRLRGEVMTLIPDPPLSSTMLLAGATPLSNQWLREMRSALDALARHPMPRNGVDLDDLAHGALAYFGLTIDATAVTWTTAHCDLHWGNVTAPTLAILDWETWGRAPTGFDAATLYCTSLLDPPNSHRVRQALAHQLDGPDSSLAIVLAAVRLLRFVEGGEMTDLAVPLRRVAESAATSLRPS